jgi:Glycosyltransferases, probably involved in cell wall biogenesis
MDSATILNSIQIILLVILGLATFYIFLFGFAGLFYRQKKYPEATRNRKIAVLIPGYKEDSVIIEVAKEALLQDYPSSDYDVVIIADSFLPETLAALRTLPIKVIEVSFEKSTKAKALNKAMEQLDHLYELAVILDADNLMEHHFLTKVNAAFEWDFKAIQGHRAAKNLDTSLAILDAVSEEINNHIFRKGHRVLGLSSAIIGSGMAFDYQYFKEVMATAKAIGGFDKELELKMLKSGYKIGYLDDAVVYDEKVAKAEVFSNQRRRWLSAQLHYFRLDFFQSVKHLILKGNVDYFDKAIQFIQPPRILLLGFVMVFGFGFLIIDLLFHTDSDLIIAWMTLMFSCVLAFLFSIPGHFYNRKTMKALLSLPKGMLLMLGSLLKVKGANKQFIHTQHGATKTDQK